MTRTKLFNVHTTDATGATDRLEGSYQAADDYEAIRHHVEAMGYKFGTPEHAEHAATLVAEPVEDYGTLTDYETAKPIRPATLAELRASLEAELHDGGTGAINVEGHTCYVDGHYTAYLCDLCGDVVIDDDCVSCSDESETDGANSPRAW